jgi:hypothetical protein
MGGGNGVRTHSFAAPGVLAFIVAGDARWCMAAAPVSVSGVVSSDQLVMRAAASAFLGRYRGQTRVHTDSDLRVFLRWCTDQDLNPLTPRRVDVERYVRWLQEVRRYQALDGLPATVGRGRLLPSLRHRRHPRTLTSRLRPPPHRAG